MEHRLQLARRARNSLKHIGGRGLLLQRFAQLVEQAGILDRDHRLVSEVRHQLDLFVGERPHLLAVDGDRADQLVVLEHGHGDERARAGELGDGGACVRLFRHEVGNVDHPFRFDDPAQGRSIEPNPRVAPPQLFERARSAMHCDKPELASFKQCEIAELGLADAYRVRQHGLEHRLQLARRARDDLEHLGGRGLLLARLVQLALQPGGALACEVCAARSARPWPGCRCPRFAAFGHALVTCPIAPATMKETIAAPTITARARNRTGPAAPAGGVMRSQRRMGSNPGSARWVKAAAMLADFRERV